MTSYLIDWQKDDFLALEEGVLVAKHGLTDSGMFTDENLAEILDNHPDDELTISTMGTDTNRFEWREGERNGVSGEVLLDFVQQGRLWLNLRNILAIHPHIANAVNSMYDELEANSPRFLAQNRSANLLISSPTALVHYHMDMPVNMLWHIRGRKRLWVYPPFDYRFVSQVVVEKVCAGEYTDDVPYDPDFDRYALVFDAEPGQLITWPQFTPHRVNNLEGLNVSLSTEHKNPRARRRINVQEANHWLRNNVGRLYRESSVDGWGAHAKQALARTVRWWNRLQGKKKEHFTYKKTFRVDPTSATGIEMFDGTKIYVPHVEEAAPL